MRGSAAFRAAVAPGGVLAGPWVKNELWRRARAVPSLDLRFAENKSLVDATTGAQLVTFTRASSGTLVGSDGLIATASNDVPRFDHNPVTGESLGLLVEEARTNNLLQSQNFSATWTVNAATVGTAIAAPDGNTTAQKIEENNTTAEHRVTQASSGGATTTAVCCSIFAKAAERTKIRIAFSSVGSWSGGGGAAVVFDLATGTATADASTPTAFGIVPYPNGWYRCFTVGTPTTSITPNTNVFLYTTTVNYAGTTGSGIYLWGAQLEAGAFPTSYIPTTTATVTRSADVASISGSNFSSWYRQDEGTVFAKYSRNSDKAPGNQIPFMISDGTGANIIAITDSANGTSDRVLIAAGNVSQMNTGSVNYTANQALARSIGYKLDDCATAVSGGNPAVDTSVTIPVVNQLNIGYAPYFSTSRVNGTIRRLTYWPQRLPNSTLQTITQ